ncbi:MAG: hypothetical protein Q8M15_11295 [Bacteroidota bacterium]|nr:hypothetical protein [Bacteroidota bacterium]
MKNKMSNIEWKNLNFKKGNSNDFFQLKIGNYLQLIPEKNSGANEMGEVTKSNNDYDVDNFVSLSKYKPIPIWKGILLATGFIKIISKRTFEIYKLRDLSIRFSSFNHFKCFYLKNEIKTIKVFHELHNFYYRETGIKILLIENIIPLVFNSGNSEKA